MNHYARLYCSLYFNDCRNAVMVLCQGVSGLKHKVTIIDFHSKYRCFQDMQLIRWPVRYSYRNTRIALGTWHLALDTPSAASETRVDRIHTTARTTHRSSNMAHNSRGMQYIVGQFRNRSVIRCHADRATTTFSSTYHTFPAVTSIFSS